jgi:hypothetical protein
MAERKSDTRRAVQTLNYWHEISDVNLIAYWRFLNVTGFKGINFRTKTVKS